MSRPKFALVTGCGQGGIGEALVKQYRNHGVHAIATILPSEASDHLTQAGISWFYLDVTSDDSVAGLEESVANLTGGFLDILVNNAGIAYTMPAIDTDVGEVSHMFDVNVFGPMRMVRHFHGCLIKTQGTVMNIGSVGGIVPYVYGSSYNASKAALQHWSNTLRVEMAPLGVNVITIISGEIGTNILKRDAQRELPKESYMSPLASEFRQHVQRRPNTTDRFEYSSQVVRQSLKSSPPSWFWYGKTSAIVRFLDTFAFRAIWDYIFWNDFNLRKLRDATLHRAETVKKD